LAHAAKIGCETFIQLSYDQDFYSEIEQLAYLQQTNLEGFASITGEVDHFVNHFLEFEEQIMLENGINAVVAKVLRNETQKLREAVYNSKLGVQTVRVQVGRLQDITCGIAKSVLARHMNETEKVEAKAKLSQISYGIGGAVIIGLNLSVADLSPAGAAVSGVLGAELVKSSVNKILEIDK
jgi:hypothetical protein